MSEYTNMYGANSASDLIQEPVSGGKHENVKITEISVEKVGQQEIPTIAFKLAFPGGKTMTHREFPVNPENIAKNIGKFRGLTVADVVNREKKRTVGAVLHILSSFIPKEHLFFQASSWEEYITKLVEVAGTAYESEEFRCKVVYSKKGFPTFPKTIASPWFQNMKDKDIIVINPKWDVVNPPVPTEEMDLDNDDLALAAVKAGEEELDF